MVRLNFQKLGQTPREGTSEEHTDAAEESADKPSSKPVRPRGRSQKKSGESGEEAETQGERKRSSKRTARKGPPEDGTPSTTTIYVANIPFEYTDDKVQILVQWRSSNSIVERVIFYLSAYFRLHCSPTDPSVYHQKACRERRGSKGPWFWVRNIC